MQRARSFLRLRHKPIAGDDSPFTSSRSLAVDLQSILSLRTRWIALAFQTTMLLVCGPLTSGSRQMILNAYAAIRKDFPSYTIDQCVTKTEKMLFVSKATVDKENNTYRFFKEKSTSYKLRSQNRTFKIADMRILLEGGIRKITVDNWKKYIAHILKEEQRLWEKDELSDSMTVPPIVINIRDISTTEKEEENMDMGVQPLRSNSD
ncbi:hypothetical protein C0J52_05706 [Blattella germanica]|nr:hypothetical protein C0J52_05706 [Blattella germanica]